MQSQSMVRVFGVCCVAAMLGLVLTGCSHPRTDRPETHPASGFLFVGNKPAAGARIQLNPVDKNAPVGVYPHVVAERDGSFQLTTYTTHDGAPVGTYALTMTWPLPSRPDREEGPDHFARRYSDRLHPVKQVQIKSGKNDLGEIHLK